MQENINIPDSTITTNLSFRQLVLMNMQQLTNFPYIEKDFDALTDYELLSLVVKFLNDVIANQNEQNASITRMYESFLALQTYVNNTKDTLESAFNNLDDYVRNYFDNLDVQEEIDNKLDEMLKDGALEQIIEQFIQSTAIWCFDTIADMKQATNLINGSYAKTLGYHSINDGGGAIYKITDTEDSNVYQEELISNLYATLIIKDNINIKQLGAYGDNIHDDTNIIQYAFNKYNSIYIPEGTFMINDTITISHNKKIYGINKNKSELSLTTDGELVLYGSYSKIKSLKVKAPENYNKSCIKIESSTNSGHIFNPVIDDLIISGTDNTGNGIEITSTSTHGSMNGIINNITFNGLHNGIYYNLATGWNSGYKISNCWEFNCVNGLDFSNNTNNPSGLVIENYKGQATSNVTNALINNLKASNCVINNCFIWDGGFTLIIAKESTLTKVYNLNNYTNQKYKDLGYHTRLLYSDQDLSIGHVKVFNPIIEGKNVFFTENASSGATISTALKNISNNKRVGILLSTGATANNYAKVYLNQNLLNEANIWKMEFTINISNLSNVELYCGGDLNQSRVQGNFVSLNTAISNNLCGIARGFDGNEYSETLISSDNLNTNSYIKCQIIYVSQTECMFFINGQYITTIHSHRYDSQPFFYIKTLDDNDKQLFISDLYCSYYSY